MCETNLLPNAFVRFVLWPMPPQLWIALRPFPPPAPSDRQPERCVRAARAWDWAALGGMAEERFDLLDEEGRPTGKTKARSAVHADGDWHAAVHIWLLALSTKEILVQKRALHKESWPGMRDMSAAGHVSAGSAPLRTACEELSEELGLDLPADAFHPVFRSKQRFEADFHGKRFVNNEFDYVYLVVVRDPIPLERYRLQESEVAGAEYMNHRDVHTAVRHPAEHGFVDAYSKDQEVSADLAIRIAVAVARGVCM